MSDVSCGQREFSLTLWLQARLQVNQVLCRASFGSVIHSESDKGQWVSTIYVYQQADVLSVYLPLAGFPARNSIAIDKGQERREDDQRRKLE